MDRVLPSDGQWARMEPHCLGKPSDPGLSGGDNRLCFEAVLWIARTGSPWRDLPEPVGKWNTIFERYRDWSGAAAGSGSGSGRRYPEKAMVLPVRIELTTSALPRMRSTTELRQHTRQWGCPSKYDF